MRHHANYTTLAAGELSEEMLRKSGAAVVALWAEWCGACHILEPAIADLVDEFQGRVAMYRVNADDGGALRDRYGVRDLPCLLFFSGGQLVDLAQGAISRSTIARKLRRLAGSESCARCSLGRCLIG